MPDELKIIQAAAMGIPIIYRKRDFTIGCCRYSLKNKTIHIKSPNYIYEIDLTTIQDSAGMLDWVFQIYNKTWGKACIIDLLECFNRIFYPQHNLCGMKINRKLPKDFLKK